MVDDSNGERKAVECNWMPQGSDTNVGYVKFDGTLGCG